MQDPRISSRLNEVLKATRDHGVQQFGCNGTCEDDWSKVLVLWRQFTPKKLAGLAKLSCVVGGQAIGGTQQYQTQLWAASLVSVAHLLMCCEIISCHESQPFVPLFCMNIEYHDILDVKLAACHTTILHMVWVSLRCH